MSFNLFVYLAITISPCSAKILQKFRFVALNIRHYITSLWNFLPLRLYSQLNNFLNTYRKRKTAISWQQFSFGWYPSRIHNLICTGSNVIHKSDPSEHFLCFQFFPSITLCLFAISFIRYSAILQAEVSIAARCSYNFPLVSRVKADCEYQIWLRVLLPQTGHNNHLNCSFPSWFMGFILAFLLQYNAADNADAAQ